MNARTQRWTRGGRPNCDGSKWKGGKPSRWRAINLVLSGLLLVSVAGCGPKPCPVTEVERIVFIPPPGACLLPVTWDAESDPATNGALWTSWLSRGVALSQAEAQAACLRSWSEDMRKLVGKPQEER